MTKPKQPKRPCEIRRERGGADIYWPPGYLDNVDWSTPPPQYDLVRVEPMKMPETKLFFMNSLEHQVTEDIQCRGCTKILIPKGGMSSSAPHTTHYLRGGELAYSCHDCEPPRKLRRPTGIQVRSPRIRRPPK